MQLFNTVNNGLVQELNRLTGATATTYPFKDKVADLGDGLDWYCSLAFKVGRNWEFDDSTETAPPIDTQNIVSGTNRYKLTAFTEKIINLIKLEIDDASGTGLALIPETLDSFGNVGVAGSGQLYTGQGQSFDDLYINAPSGTPSHYLKYGDFIYLRPNPNYNATAGLKAYFNRAATKFEFVPVTVTIASPGVFTATSHGLSAGDTVILETDGALPTGLTADTQYYVISTGLSANDFRLSATSGGSAINTSGSQSGNHAFLKTSASPGINTMHHKALCNKAALNFMSFNNTNGIYNSRIALVAPLNQKDEQMITQFFANRDKDVRKRLSVRQQDNR